MYMRKVIAGINMSLDGYCDHTVGIADEELHQHYTQTLNDGGVLLYGRITYQMMEDYWPSLVKSPSGSPSLDAFAVAIDHIPKVVFSNSLRKLSWDSARLATRPLKEEVEHLKQQQGKDIFVGSPSLISAMTELKLIDEYQLCIHPVIAGKGLPLFKGLTELMRLHLLGSKTLGSGATILYYKPYR